MESTFKPALMLTAGRTLGFAATFLIPVVLARVFDLAEFGTYKQLFLIFVTLFGLAQVGMAESLYYFLPRSPRDGGPYAANAMLALTASGLACVVLLYGAGPAIGRWMSNDDLPRYLPLLALHLWLMLTAEVLERVMVSRKRYLAASCSYGCSELLRAVFLVVPVLLLHDLEWMLIGAVAFSTLRLCVVLGYLWVEFQGTLRPDVTLLKQQLAYAMPFQMAVVVDIIQANLHQYAVSFSFDAATFAIYSVGCLQVPFVEFVANPAANVMMVRMTEEIRDGNVGAVVAMWHDTTRKLALLFFPLVGLLLVNAREIIVLFFTESYSASVPIFMVCSAAILLSALQTDAVLRVYAETGFLLRLNVIRLLFIAILITWFLSALQLVGAILVTVLAIAVGKGLALHRMTSLMRVGFWHLVPWPTLAGILGSAAAAGLVAWMVKAMFDLGTLPLLVSTSLVYMAAYLPLVAGFHLLRLRPDERQALSRWLESWAARLART